FEGGNSLDFWFESYGDRERVTPSKLDEAGFTRLDFADSSIGKITSWDDQDGWPLDGWKYVDLVISTTELLKVFPLSDPSPAPIELENGSCDFETAAILP